LTIPETCLGQNVNVRDLSDESQANYFLANINRVKFLSHQLFEGGLYINAFIIDDSKATPTGFFEETEEILSSILISIMPEVDYYTKSKLYKIEGLENPKIVSLKEKEFPEFMMTLESGPVENRQTFEYNLRGFDQ
jgi:hypothetical protein